MDKFQEHRKLRIAYENLLNVSRFLDRNKGDFECDLDIDDTVKDLRKISEKILDKLADIKLI